MAVRVIFACWAQKRLIPTGSRHDVRRVHSYFLDMMYVEFIKNFFLVDSSELMAVRVISASWAQKLFIPTF